MSGLVLLQVPWDRRQKHYLLQVEQHLIIKHDSYEEQALGIN